MGFFTSILQTLGILNKPRKILMIGLDNSGKTTIVKYMKAERVAPSETIPTVGYNLDEFRYHRTHFTVFDMSGAGRYRDLWERYYTESDGIIFVVDTSDKIRVCVARDEVEGVLESRALKSRPTPILFLANKIDIENGMTPAEISQALGLETIKNRNWYICGCNALTGEGLHAGFEWLTDQLTKLP